MLHLFGICQGRLYLMERQMIVEAEALATDLFSLDEPWRSRFLDLVANMATRWKWNGHQPTREEIVAWLGRNPALYREIRLLLRAWQRP